MTKVQRIGNLITAVVMIAFAWLLFVSPVEGLPVVAIVVSISFTVRGLRRLVYYYTMARHMVGGLASLLAGVLLIDFGVLSVSFSDEPLGYMFLYLAGWNAFSGLIALLRALEARRNGGRSWKFNTLYGVVSILIAIACLVYRDKPDILCQAYCIGLGYSGIMRLVNAFRRTEIVYIQ